MNYFICTAKEIYSLQKISICFLILDVSLTDHPFDNCHCWWPRILSSMLGQTMWWWPETEDLWHSIFNFNSFLWPHISANEWQNQNMLMYIFKGGCFDGIIHFFFKQDEEDDNGVSEMGTLILIHRRPIDLFLCPLSNLSLLSHMN